MTIALTKERVKAVLQGITSPQALAKVYDQAKEATSIGEMPVAIIYLAPQVDQSWSMAAHGLARHDYSLYIVLLVGNRSAGLPTLVSRAESWPEPLQAALFPNLTLDGAVEWIGSVDTPNLFTYQIGPIPWGQQPGEEPNYFGLRITLPVTEKINQEMGG